VPPRLLSRCQEECTCKFEREEARSTNFSSLFFVCDSQQFTNDLEPWPTLYFPPSASNSLSLYRSQQLQMEMVSPADLLLQRSRKLFARKNTLTHLRFQLPATSASVQKPIKTSKLAILTSILLDSRLISQIYGILFRMKRKRWASFLSDQVWCSWNARLDDSLTTKSTVKLK